MVIFLEFWDLMRLKKLANSSFWIGAGFWVLLGTVVPQALAASPGKRTVSFNRDVRPILSDTCYTCHGPDEAHRMAGLRLDQRNAALQEADSGEFAIVPGDVESSELVARIISDDPDMLMPPHGGSKSLTPEQISTLRQWIVEGASYEDHWAFVAPERPEIPQLAKGEQATADKDPVNPIDRFILSKLHQEGLAHSEMADRRTLIRRVTLDLTGLLPSTDEVEAFLKDSSKDAYEKVVDRLLNSPRYGERMAVPWLDYARYGDSHGFQIDGSRYMWAWRDWVINAYNRNMPFDQFTIEQLAGDMLPNPKQDQIIATGFNRNHRLNGEGGVIAEEWFVETVIDRVETTGLTWLGLTFNCCRCHDHKYDPISQKEFYGMFAIFNSVQESGLLGGDNTPPVLKFSSAQQDADLAQIHRRLQDAEERILDEKLHQDKLIAKWKTSTQEEWQKLEAPWKLLTDVQVVSEGGAEFTQLEDQSFLAQKTNPAHDTYVITAPYNDPLGGLMLEVLPDPSLPGKSVGRGYNGNFALTGLEVQLHSESLSEPMPVELVRAEADYEQSGWPAAATIKQIGAGADRRGWAVSGDVKREPRKLVVVPVSLVDVPQDAKLTITMRHQSYYGDHNVGRFRVSASSWDPGRLSVKTKGLPEDIVKIFRIASSDWTESQNKTLETYYLTNVPNPIKTAIAQRDAIQEEIKAHHDSLPTTMVMKEGNRRDAYLLERGEYDKRGEKVARILPAVLPPLRDGEPMNRLGFARWVVDPSNPLTARVWVNRAWEMFFGTGIVKTSENFGSQAEYPSHPELLDWLACEFIQPSTHRLVNGLPARSWDMKALHKLIVTSATYRQSSHLTPELLERDPENRLLARGARFRLAGEWIRDSALASGGLLVDKIGGPSVRPYMPKGVWSETSRYGDLQNYKHDTDENLYRRTMYTIWKRTAAPPTMLLFDAPNREVCTIKRSRTNTPLQALSLLNEVTFVESARGLAQRMITDGGENHQQRIHYAYSLLFSRPPTSEEATVLSDGLQRDLERYQADLQAAKELIKFGESAPSKRIDPAELAAYTLTANVLLNLDEFVTRE